MFLVFPNMKYELFFRLIQFLYLNFINECRVSVCVFCFFPVLRSSCVVSELEHVTYLISLLTRDLLVILRFLSLS